MEHKVDIDYTNVESSNSSVKVFIRARPPESNSDDCGNYIFPLEQRKISIHDPSNSNRNYGEHKFMFDRIFWTNSKQEEVFEMGGLKHQV